MTAKRQQKRISREDMFAKLMKHWYSWKKLALVGTLEATQGEEGENKHAQGILVTEVAEMLEKPGFSPTYGELTYKE